MQHLTSLENSTVYHKRELTYPRLSVTSIHEYCNTMQIACKIYGTFVWHVRQKLLQGRS